MSPFVRLSAWNNSAPTGRIFVQFDFWIFFENPLRKFKFYLNLTRITSTLHEDRITFLFISRSFLPRIKMIQTKVVEKVKAQISCSMTPPPENRAVYEITWKNFVDLGRPRMEIRCMRMSRWAPKATNTHSGCVIHTYCFSTATVVARMHLNVTLHVHCLSCLMCIFAILSFRAISLWLIFV
jgi:hypothetical protein